MPLVPLQVRFTASWLSHDAWSEAYIGTRKLAYEILPDPSRKLSPEDCALCKLSLIGANHLVEVALYNALLPHGAQGKLFSATDLKRAKHQRMEELLRLVASPAELEEASAILESIQRLRKRRNETIHKSSALATAQMARSALYSAVRGVEVVFQMTRTPFPYSPVLAKYPLHSEVPFSLVAFPPDA